MKDTAQILQRLGFGEYEAKAYMALLQRSPMTGYEIAKVSRIPRANVYNILPGLEDRGAVVRVDSPSGVKYSAVPPSELMPRLADRFNDDLVAAEQALSDVGRVPEEEEYAWNIDNPRAVMDHARSLIDSAEHELLLAVWPQEAVALESNLSQAEARGVGITTLCQAACPQECGRCRGHIYRYRVSPEELSRWLVVAADAKEMLAGEIRVDDTAYAVRTTQQLLVELGGWYVRNSVALATLVADLGDRLPELLSPEAASVLASVGRGGMGGGWLEQIREVLSYSDVA
ncbi:MAG TPA: helix-turn-helix domain-containing protein [Chloroflexia bacterium]|nr:helix-turn-helix domain-containing protein [Chloroflexia bacterium]